MTVQFTFSLQEGITAAQLASNLENSAISEVLPMIVKKPFQPPEVSRTFLTLRHDWPAKMLRSFLQPIKMNMLF